MRHLGVGLLAALLIARTSIAAQATTATPAHDDVTCPKQERYPTDKAVLPSYQMRSLNRPQIHALRDSLQHGRWAGAIRIFSNSYQSALPAWIVYIDSNGHVSQCILADQYTGPILRQKRFVWAMVFSDRSIDPPKAKSNRDRADSLRKLDSAAKQAAAEQWSVARIAQKAYLDSVRIVATPQSLAKLDSIAKAATANAEAATKSAAAVSLFVTANKPDSLSDTLYLRLARRVVVRQADPVLIGLIKGFAKPFGFDPPQTAQLADSVRNIELRQMGDSTEQMWVGFGRIGLIDNAVIELSLAPWPPREFPIIPKADSVPEQLQRIYTNVADVRERTFELGLLTGVSFGRNVPSYDQNLRLISNDDPYKFNSYATVIVNTPWQWSWWSWKENPWQRTALGGFIGTNIVGTPGDQLVLGASLGHVLSDAGLAFGNAWVPTKVLRGTTLADTHVRRWFFGIDLRL
jgi:hypothetical protein